MPFSQHCVVSRDDWLGINFSSFPLQTQRENQEKNKNRVKIPKRSIKLLTEKSESIFSTEPNTLIIHTIKKKGKSILLSGLNYPVFEFSRMSHKTGSPHVLNPPSLFNILYILIMSPLIRLFSDVVSACSLEFLHCLFCWYCLKVSFYYMQ